MMLKKEKVGSFPGVRCGYFITAPGAAQAEPREIER